MMCEEASGATVTGLDFVEDETGVVSRGELPELLEEGIVGEANAAYTLYGFDDDGGDVAL